MVSLTGSAKRPSGSGSSTSMATRQLLMKADPYQNGWHGQDREFLCGDSLREYYDIPTGTEEIVLHVSDKLVRSAIHAIVHKGESWIEARIATEGNIHVLVPQMSRWLGLDPFWFWIEY